MKSLALALTMSLTASVGFAADTMHLETALIGKTTATGSFAAINGTRRSFTVDVTGRWNGKVFTLREDFVYDDGQRDTKTWHFTKKSANSYVGTREDVIGTTTLTVNGRFASFDYDVWLDGETRKNKAHFYDKLELRPDGSVKNRALVTKFGIPVARVKVEFTR
jgi:hypothetical protein